MTASTTHGRSDSWRFAGNAWSPAPLPRLMGILNVTPDSFSDGGRFIDVQAAVEQGRRLAAEGADLIDIGGESTRPGAAPVDADEELRRVVPVIERLSAAVSVPISIDTMKGRVAQAALAAGATLVNDVSAGRFDPELLRVCADSDCGVILMHMLGTPQTMQADPRYDDVVREVHDFLAERIAACELLGIARQRIAVDPGIGFGKTTDHNLSLLTHIDALRAGDRPVLIGHSRKRFLYKLLGRETDERRAGTIGVSIALAMQGVDLLRVHDVGSVRDALRTWHAVRAGV
jgi:dihydropteroate synthase